MKISNNTTVKVRISEGDWEYKKQGCKRAILNRMVRKIFISKLKTKQTLKKSKEKIAFVWWQTIPGREKSQVQLLKGETYLICSRNIVVTRELAREHPLLVTFLSEFLMISLLSPKYLNLSSNLSKPFYYIHSTAYLYFNSKMYYFKEYYLCI